MGTGLGRMEKSFDDMVMLLGEIENESGDCWNPSVCLSVHCWDQLCAVNWCVDVALERVYADPVRDARYADPVHVARYADLVHAARYADPVHAARYGDPYVEMNCRESRGYFWSRVNQKS